MNLKLKIFSVFIVVIVTLLLIYNFIYQPHRNIAEEKAFKELTSMQFINAYENDSTFLKTHINQTIVIYANTIELDFENKMGLIDGKISARFNSLQEVSHSTLGNKYIKGRFVGYDELLEEFQMDQCTLINK